MTIANEKTSASLLNFPQLTKISGAIHRVLCPCSRGALRVESRFRVTMERPQFVIRAQPVVSTRMFCWLDVNMPVVKQSRIVAYSLEIPVNNVAGVEIIKTFCDIR